MAAHNTIKIGVVATLIGPFEALGNEGLAGAALAVDEFGGQVAGKPIEVAIRGSNAIPDSAVDAVLNLLDVDGVDFVIGPLSGNEGLAVRDYAMTRPDRAFLNGCAGAQDITLRNPAPNFFNFFPDAVQNMAGLGTFVYEQLGYRRMVTLAEDYSYPHSMVGGFNIEFCRAGGRIVQRFWVALGKRDYSDFFRAVPQDIDAVFVSLTGKDAIEFFRQYTEAGLNIPLVGGANTFDPVTLNASPSLAESLIGTPSASPVSEDNPSPLWKEFVSAYQAKFPNGASSPSIPTYGYYLNTKAALLALAQIDGEFGEDQANFKAALARLEFESPTGMVYLDGNRQVIINNFVNVLDQRTDGTFYNRIVETIPHVNQTLGIPEEDYLPLGSLGRDTDIESWVEKLSMR
ncbi:MAG: ABC transporter substrate-binding protein [Chloroflexi bacterium]|nr:ABC transporter substrate-binding protein [Chloroflexota bacterium]